MSISLNLVIRNEEHRLENMLSSVREYVDEIIVVDQESTDSSVDICKSFNAKVYNDKCTGYADSSRQLAMDKSSCDWILTMDADEFLTTRFGTELQFLKKDKFCDGYYICLGLLRVASLNELPLSYIHNIGWYIDVPHESRPNQYRFYKKNHVVIKNWVHGGIAPTHFSLIRYLHYNGIVEIKTFEEDKLDKERYQCIITASI